MTAWQFCTSGSAIGRAGLYAQTIPAIYNSGSLLVNSGSLLLGFYNAAEGKIEQETATAFSDNYTTLPIGVQNQLSNVCSSLIAMDIVQYSPSSYLTREADMLMNKNSSIIAAGMNALNDKTKHSFRLP
jgi:hypothetical protein